MGSNNCSNVYVYAHTSPGPSSSPSIRWLINFPTSHITFRFCFNSSETRRSFAARTRVYFFRVMLIAQLRNIFPAGFCARKRNRPLHVLVGARHITFFTHSFLCGGWTASIFPHVLICKSGNFHMQFSISQVAFLDPPIQEQSWKRALISFQRTRMVKSSVSSAGTTLISLEYPARLFNENAELR